MTARKTPLLALGSLLTLVVLLAFVANSPRAEEPASQPKDTIPYMPRGNPIFDAYLIGRFSNEELARLERSEPVYTALLTRPGMDVKFRREALTALAKLRESDQLGELIGGIEHVDEKGGDLLPVLEELAPLVVGWDREELVTKRGGLEELATSAKQPTTQSIAMAAILVGDGEAEKVWELATSSGKVASLLGGLKYISNAKVYEPLYPEIKPLLASDDADLQQAAIRGIVRFPGEYGDAFAALADLIAKGQQREAAVSAILAIPADQWPKDQATPLGEALVAYFGEMPAARRTTPHGQEVSQLAEQLAALLPESEAAAIRRGMQRNSVRVIELDTVREEMQYDKKVLVVEAGRPLQINLSNSDAMPHNLVVVKPRSTDEVGIDAELPATRPEEAAQREYIPDNENVLHYTPMLNPGQKHQLNFTAPEKPEVYAYVCTYPGHWRRMYGALIVVEDREAYLADNMPLPAAEDVLSVPKVIQEYTFEDLESAVDQVAAERTFAKGQRLFLRQSCLSCHKMKGVGGKVGPELTDVAKRHRERLAKEQGSQISDADVRRSILREVVDPSHRVEEKYRRIIIQTDSGEQIEGVVVAETDSEYQIMPDPLAQCEPTIVEKDEILRQKRSPLSSMPTGLLNTLHKEDIWDLLAFVLAGGDPANQAFQP